jgi:hypothetical protein
VDALRVKDMPLEMALAVTDVDDDNVRKGLKL